MCTGAATAEMSRSVLQNHVRASGYDMKIETVAVWDTCLDILPPRVLRF